MAKRKESKRKIPFWLQIVLILAIGIAASGIVLIVAHGKKGNDQTDAVMHTVTFCYDDGTIIEQKEAKDGAWVFPPDYAGEGVFRGWNTAINRVTMDTEAHPMIYDIVEDNLFYFDSMYVQEGEKFSLDLFVGGNVNVSSGELTLEYDPAVLTYQKANGDIPCEFSEEIPGTLKITFSAPEPITETTKLASITFRAEIADVYSTQVLLSAENVKLQSKNGETIVDFATINNEIYFLQEATR